MFAANWGGLDLSRALGVLCVVSIPLIVSIADALGARVEIAVSSPGSPGAGRKRAAA